MSAQGNEQKILILATETCAYPGANAVGQAHITYPANTYILRVRSPVLFPEKFYLDCFAKGIGGIIIMSCGRLSRLGGEDRQGLQDDERERVRY